MYKVPNMRTCDAIDYFNGDRKALGEAFRFPANKATISKWFKAGFLPYGRALELEKETKGKLKVDYSCYPTEQQTAA